MTTPVPAPVRPRPVAAVDFDIVPIAELSAYLRRHGLRIRRVDWPRGEPRPVVTTEPASISQDMRGPQP